MLQQIAPAYRQASGSQKQQLLENFVTATGYARKYALWLLNHLAEVFAPPGAIRRRYGPEVEEALVLVWKTLNRICTKRLIPFLPDILATLEEDANCLSRNLPLHDAQNRYATDHGCPFPKPILSCFVSVAKNMEVIE